MKPFNILTFNIQLIHFFGTLKDNGNLQQINSRFREKYPFITHLIKVNEFNMVVSQNKPENNVDISQSSDFDENFLKGNF